MPFVPDPTPPGYFQPDEEKSVAGFGKNLVGEVKGTLADIDNLGDRLIDHPVDTLTSVAKGLPGALVNEGKRVGVGELLTGHPINAVEKLGNAMYEKPIATTGDLFAGYGAAKGLAGLGSRALKTAATEAGEVAPAAAEEATAAAAKAAPEAAQSGPQVIGNTVAQPKEFQPTIIGRRATDLPEGAPATPPPPSPPPTGTPPPAASAVPFQDEAQQALQKAKELKQYIGNAYTDFAKKPGNVESIADYIQEKSQMMANQQLGATPLQARQVGHEAMRAIGQYALDNDIVSPAKGLRGMRARNAELLNKAGKGLDALRNKADALRNPLETPVDVLQGAHAKLDPKYARGAYSGQAGQYAKAIEDLEDAKPTFSGMSEAATKLNKAANEAARLKQPHGPFTDVANTISEINNARIKQLLGPEEGAQYEHLLKEYGVNKKIQQMLERKSAGEVKRLGPGSFSSNMIQKGLDEVGYKVGASAANKLSTAVIKNPGIAKDLPSLFKEFIHHVDLPEVDGTTPGAGLAHGGIVEDEMHELLNHKYGKKETQ